MNEQGTVLPDRGVYHGNSMSNVFVDGDILFFEEVPFDQLECGDIVAVFERSPYYVHRIVKKENGFAVTMGDNNTIPDKLELNQNSKFGFVRNYIPIKNPGTVLSVTSGTDGMEQFQRWQKHLWRKHRLVGILSPLRFFGRFRIPAKKETKFRDGTVQWSFVFIPVAARNPAGKTKYLSRWKRLFFRVPKRPADMPEVIESRQTLEPNANFPHNNLL